MTGTHSAPAEHLAAVQRLALAYAPRAARLETWAVLALDMRLAGIVRSRREPIMAQLRLAWWRDTLRQPPESWPRGEPILDALSDWGDPGRLATLPEGWEALLAEELSPDVIAEYAESRGRAYGSLADELGAGEVEDATAAGRLWALADLAANLSEGAERKLVVEYARAQPPPPRLPAALRPLTVLAGLARRAIGRRGAPLLDGPGAALLAMRLGIAGR